MTDMDNFMPLGLSPNLVDLLIAYADQVCRNLRIKATEISITDRKEMLRTCSVLHKLGYRGDQFEDKCLGRWAFESVPNTENLLQLMYGADLELQNVKLTDIVCLCGHIHSIAGDLLVSYPYLARSTRTVRISELIQDCSLWADVDDRVTIDQIRAALQTEVQVAVYLREFHNVDGFVQVAPMLEFERWPSIWNKDWGDLPSFSNKVLKSVPKLST